MTTTRRRTELSEAMVYAWQTPVTGRRELETNDKEFLSRGDLAYTDLHSGAAMSCCCLPDLYESLASTCTSAYEWVRYSKQQRLDRVRARAVRDDCLEQVTINHGTIEEVVVEYRNEIAARTQLAKDKALAELECVAMGFEDFPVLLEQDGVRPLRLSDHTTTEAIGRALSVHEALCDAMANEASDDELDGVEDFRVNGAARILEEAGVSQDEYEHAVEERLRDSRRQWAVVESVGGAQHIVKVSTEPRIVQKRLVGPMQSERLSVNVVAKHLYSSKLVSVLINETRGKYGRLESTVANHRIVSHYMRRSLSKYGLQGVSVDRHVTFAASMFFSALHYDLLQESLMEQNLLRVLGRAGG